MNNKNIIALIPARGGSKSIREKNLSILGNKTLLKRTIDVALECKFINRVIVSTDNKKIKKHAIKYGAEVYQRAPNLATDKALVIDTIRHLHKVLISERNSIDIMILLEPTSPFRDKNLIKKCISKLIDKNLDSIATFHKAEIHPEKTWQIENDVPTTYLDDVDAWTPRQVLSEAYQLNGLVYAFKPNKLPNNTNGLLFGAFGAEIVSNEKVIDIDDEKDLILANVMNEVLK